MTAERDYFEQFSGVAEWRDDPIQHIAYVGKECPRCHSHNTYSTLWYDGAPTGNRIFQCVNCWKLFSKPYV